MTKSGLQEMIGVSEDNLPHLPEQARLDIDPNPLID